MISTGISSYLQNSGVQKENLVQPQSQSSRNQEVEEDKNRDAVNVTLSPQAKAMLKIDDFQKQLDEIFGVKKELNPDELEKEKDLISQIKSIKENLDMPYSLLDKETIRSIDQQMKEILEKERHDYKDDSKLLEFSKQIHSIVKKYDGDTLKDNDNEKLSKLVQELRTLQGYKNPDVLELIDAEKIYTKMKMVEIELKASQLDINSTSFHAESEKLQEQFSLAEETLSKLDNDKVEYAKEETRETSKNAIRNSLKMIATIQNDFFGSSSKNDFIGYSSSITMSEQTYGLTQGSNTENKWLDFLQTTREELYTGSQETQTAKSEDSDLLNIINRVTSLHE